MTFNTLLIIGIIIAVAGVLSFLYIKSKREKPEYKEEDKYTFEHLIDVVKQRLLELVKEENIYGVSDAAYDAAYKRRSKIINALQDSVYGIDSAKIQVLDLIENVIREERVDEIEIQDVVNFEEAQTSASLMFEIMMHFYKITYGKDALDEVIKKYNWATARYIIEDGKKPTFIVTNEMLREAFLTEKFNITYDDMVAVTAILVFQRYKGFGVIDTLREMNINGLSCGTSGSILYNIMSSSKKKVHKAHRSVWVQYKGKYIHFRFLSFGSEEELKRVTQLICRYNNPGPLTEKRGAIVTTMYDKSRVLALRPPASEYWAFFIRKFSLGDIQWSTLCNPQKPVVNTDGQIEMTSIYKNWEMAYGIVKYAMLGQLTTGFTGRQSSGKTTAMSASVEFSEPTLNLRVLEMTPELYLRELYPERNILSVAETSYISAAKLQDFLKKSDAAVSIVGEVATDDVAARMVQMAQVASLYTIFSHHATTTANLVFALRNSLVNSGGFTMQTAEEQIVGILPLNIHFDFDNATGIRYIARVTEIIPTETNVPYPTYDPSNPVDSMNRITAEYYQRQTDRASFTTRDIMHFEKETLTYVADSFFTEERRMHMITCMPKENRPEFKEFFEKYWGGEKC